jgi:hypothetical protein
MSKEKYTGRPLEVLKDLTIAEMKGSEILFLNSQSAPKADKKPSTLGLAVAGIIEGAARGYSDRKEKLITLGTDRAQRLALEEEEENIVEAMRKDPVLMSAIRTAKQMSEHKA